MPGVLLHGAAAALEEGAPRRWKRGGWGLISSNLFVGGRRGWCWGVCLASVPGLSVTVWSLENHLPPPCSPSVPGSGRWGRLSPSLPPSPSQACWFNQAYQSVTTEQSRLHSLAVTGRGSALVCLHLCLVPCLCCRYNPLHSWRRDETSERIRSESSEAHMLHFLVLRLCWVTIWGLRTKEAPRRWLYLNWKHDSVFVTLKLHCAFNTFNLKHAHLQETQERRVVFKHHAHVDRKEKSELVQSAAR